MAGLLDKLTQLTKAAKPFSSGLLEPVPVDVESNGNVDFDFIKEREGFNLNGYVPVDKKTKIPLGESGVTIASGFDLGQRGLKDLSGLPENIQIKLKPYLGLKKELAQKKLDKFPVSITNDEALIVNEFAKADAISKLKKRWKAKTGNDFESLPRHQATPIASVAFQYGDLAKKTPNFWNQVTSNDWEGAKKNLANFGDKYSDRRKLELDYLNNPVFEENKQQFLLY